MLTAAKLGRAADTQVATIRHYERLGLMPKPERTEANYRLYDDGAVPRLRFIRRARELCFSLEQIKTMLDLSDAYAADGRCSDDTVEEYLGEVDRRITDLHLLRRELKAVSDGCASGGADRPPARIVPVLGA